MKDKIIKLLEEHKLLAQENFTQLELISQLDTSKFGEKEKQEITMSITELEFEYSLRKSWISELESLL